jgi:hypothetical protein
VIGLGGAAVWVGRTGGFDGEDVVMVGPGAEGVVVADAFA